jgi:hypothetical protein
MKIFLILIISVASLTVAAPSMAGSGAVKCYAYNYYSDRSPTYPSRWYQGFFACRRAGNEALRYCGDTEGSGNCVILDCVDELEIRGACR